MHLDTTGKENKKTSCNALGCERSPKGESPETSFYFYDLNNDDDDDDDDDDHDNDIEKENENQDDNDDDNYNALGCQRSPKGEGPEISLYFDDDDDDASDDDDIDKITTTTAMTMIMHSAVRFCQKKRVLKINFDDNN